MGRITGRPGRDPQPESIRETAKRENKTVYQVRKERAESKETAR